MSTADDARGHCRWCGRYVAKNAEPIAGFNAYGRRVEQLLCDECGPNWRNLAAANEKRLIESDFGREHYRRALEDAADGIDLGPQIPLPPSIYSALCREWAEDVGTKDGDDDE